mgnify:CR=1 FL=1
MDVSTTNHFFTNFLILIVSSSASEGKLLNIDKITSHFSVLSRTNILVLLKCIHQVLLNFSAIH